MDKYKFRTIRDLDGVEYPLQATMTVDMELEGNHTISGVIKNTDLNSEFIVNIREMWEIIDFNGIVYKILYLSRDGVGDTLEVDIKASPLFYDYMETNSMLGSDGIHIEYNGSMTVINAFNMIFKNTPYTINLTSNAPSLEWSGFGGGESLLESFKRALDRYMLEFVIRKNNVVEIKDVIGRDTNNQYRYRLNANNVSHEIDANEFYTAIKGYGDFGDSESEDGEDTSTYKNAGLIRNYVSPLSKIMGIRNSPPLLDGRISKESTMDYELKSRVDSSLKISISADIEDLKSQEYPIEDIEMGDRVFMIDERLSYSKEIRIVSSSITTDWSGRVIDAGLVFGSLKLSRRYKGRTDSVIDDDMSDRDSGYGGGYGGGGSGGYINVSDGVFLNNCVPGMFSNGYDSKRWLITSSDGSYYNPGSVDRLVISPGKGIRYNDGSILNPIKSGSKYIVIISGRSFVTDGSYFPNSFASVIKVNGVETTMGIFKDGENYESSGAAVIQDMTFSDNQSIDITFDRDPSRSDRYNKGVDISGVFILNKESLGDGDLYDWYTSGAYRLGGWVYFMSEEIPYSIPSHFVEESFNKLIKEIRGN